MDLRPLCPSLLTFTISKLNPLPADMNIGFREVERLCIAPLFITHTQLKNKSTLFMCC